MSAHAIAESAIDLFPSDYFTARECFLTSARQRNAVVVSHAIRAKGPRDETLSVDTAYLGADEPRRLLVVLSGTHGVEGLAGSALQQQWLVSNESAQLPADTGCLLVHALNPYGFAWMRRVNEHNVDLNRNALRRFPGPTSAGYRRLAAWLNPPSPPRLLDGFLLQGAARIARYGFAPLQQAIVEGQYEYPIGLFYGGTQTEESLDILWRILAERRWAKAERVVVIDIHTGIGRPGTHKLMVDHDEGTPAFGEMTQWFGAGNVVSNRPADSLAYRVSGGLTERIAQMLGPERTYAAVLEFGTIPAIRMLAVLRRENRAFHYSAPDSAARQQAAAAMRGAFCPRQETWRSRVLAGGGEMIRRAKRACVA